MKEKAIVAVGVLVLFVVVGALGTATADQPPPPYVTVEQEPDRVNVVFVSKGNEDAVSLVAPDDNRSTELPVQVGAKITVTETPEERTVPGDDYLTTRTTKTEGRTCWMTHGGIELGDGITVSETVDIPCSGGEITEPQNPTAVGGSADAVLFEPGQTVRYMDGTYEVRALLDGEVAGTESFAVGPDDTDNSLYDIMGIIAVVALLAMAAILVAVGLREVLEDE